MNAAALRRFADSWPRTVGSLAVVVAAGVVLAAFRIPVDAWGVVGPALLTTFVGGATTDAVEAGRLTHRAAEALMSVPLAALVVGFLLLLLDSIGAPS